MRMHKIVNERYQERYVEETLENGLHVVLWHKEDYEKSLFMMSTPLGALDLQQVDEQGELYTFPAGIAHFLEHKMFEMGEKDVMDLFSKMGASVNAFTSYSETAYYFSTSNDIEKPLHLLLDFVQSLQITKESVEKEKGIIIQELNMYKQMPDNRLLMEVFSSLYQEHPLKYDIGGDDDSVTSITLEQLQECYRLNYHPSTMVLVGVTSKDPQVVLNIIKENQSKKTFPIISNVVRKQFTEPKEVARETYAFTMDVSIPKVAFAYKLEGIVDSMQRTKQEWCIKTMMDALFSSLNPAYQTWIDEGIINDYVGCEVDLGKDHGMIMFYAESVQIEAFESIVDETMTKMMRADIDEETLLRLKRRYFGQSVRSLNSFDDIAITYIRNHFEELDFFEAMDVLYDINKDDLVEVSKQLEKCHRVQVTIMPENKE